MAADANLTILLPHLLTDSQGHVHKAKSYADRKGSDELAEIKATTDACAVTPPILHPATDEDGICSPPPASQLLSMKSCEEIVRMPPGQHGNLDPSVVHDTPLPSTPHQCMP